MTAATFSIAAAAAASAAATATATFAAEDLGGLFDFLKGGFAVLKEGACELQGLASQGVIEVNGDLVVCNLDDGSHEVVTLAVHEGHLGTREDVLVVELTVDLEHLTWHRTHQLLVALAECFGSLEREVEGVTRLQLCQLLLEGFDHETHACDKGNGLAVRRFVEQLMTCCAVGEHLICYLDVLLGHTLLV